MNWTYIHVFTRANGSNSATTGCLSSFNFLLFLGWTGVIAYKDKEQIVTTAILHEVIWKRESSINQLFHGLKFFNVLDVVRKFPQHFIAKFIYTNTVLNSTVLLQHIKSYETSNNFEERAKEFFIEYLDEDVEIPCGDSKFLCTLAHLLCDSTKCGRV